MTEPRKRSRDKYSYLHNHTTTEIIEGKKTVNEEQVFRGPNGIGFKYFSQAPDKKTKIIGIQNPDGTFKLIIREGDKQEIKNFTKDDLLKELKKKENTHLKFAFDFVKDQKAGAAKLLNGALARTRSRSRSRSRSRRGSRGGARPKRPSRELVVYN